MTEGRQKRLQLSNEIFISKYSKSWETLLAYLQKKKRLVQSGGNPATRFLILNAQLFVACHATYKAFYKKVPPIEIKYYIMTISLTCIIAHLIN